MGDGGDSEAASARAGLSRALGRVAAGDEGALQEVYSRTSAKLFGICLRILGDRGEAEDALQDVYVSVWRRAGSFDGERGSPITWLATLARNRAIDRLRSAKRARASEPVEAGMEIADSAPSAFDRLEASETSGRLAGCIGELEDRTGLAIREAFFGGFTYAELADRMKVPLGTMKSWIRRGLTKLKDCLER